MSFGVTALPEANQTSAGWREKPEFPWKTGRTGRHHKEGPVGIRTGPSSLQGESANHCISVQPALKIQDLQKQLPELSDQDLRLLWKQRRFHEFTDTAGQSWANEAADLDNQSWCLIFDVLY